jgi:hypothetical protein
LRGRGRVRGAGDWPPRSPRLTAGFALRPTHILSIARLLAPPLTLPLPAKRRGEEKIRRVSRPRNGKEPGVAARLLASVETLDRTPSSRLGGAEF